MAVYEKLLLSAGGGIISVKQQAEQVENTASILIGLGGTGIDCLKEVKSSVFERLVPDDPDEVVPKYSHIQFIGIDTDKRSAQRSGDEDKDADRGSLDESEYFDISNPQAEQMLRNTQALQAMKEFDWIKSDDLRITNMAEAGAGGLRQAGRYMLMGRSRDFYDRITQAIHTAKTDIPGCALIVHVFSGLGGGTGSGTFLDVCYLAKEAVRQNGGGNVFGYFFLPDVNLDIDRIPLDNKLVRGYIPVNGYAAMQELDYCMRLEENGGSFRQQYGGGLTVEWTEPPVNMCHLVCASDVNRNVISNAYEYAMKVTAEYVMNFLTKPDNPKDFGIESHYSNFRKQVSQADSTKLIGSSLNYCIIGGSCASVPMREINTYLASSVFGMFAGVRNNVASEFDVKAIASEARIGNLDMLLGEISENGGDSQFFLEIDYKTAKTTGSGPIVRSFEKQRTEKQGILEKNARSMTDVNNKKSLIGRARSVLDKCACDIYRGTTFAGSVISAAQSHNLLNIVDGLIEQNQQRLDYERHQIEDAPESGFVGRRTAYNETKIAIDKKVKKSTYNNFVDAMFAYEENYINITRHEQMGTVLAELKKQLVLMSDGYYQILARVMDNLIATFAENERVLNGDTAAFLDPSGFVTPIIELSDIRGTLDEEIRKLSDSMPNLYERLVHGMLRDSRIWINETEREIAHYVNSYFVEQIFGDSSVNSFANKTISEYLVMKYKTNDPRKLENRIYNDYMLPLSHRANPLFPLDPTIKEMAQRDTMTVVSVPTTAREIDRAARQLTARVNTSALRDRIYLMNCTIAVPMAAYSNCSHYGKMYFEGSLSPGTHYYEGGGASEWFNDWRKLPALIPASVIRKENAPRAVILQIEEMDRIYKAAADHHLLEGSRCMKLTEESRRAIRDALDQAERAKKSLSARPEKTAAVCRAVKELLEEALAGITTEPTPYSLPEGSKNNDEIIEKIRRDYFFISPAIRAMMEADIALTAAAENGIREIGRIAEEHAGARRDVKKYCEALFTGVLAHKGLSVEYRREEYGQVTVVPLCRLSDQFRYSRIPFYQGYLSYQQLDPGLKSEISDKATRLLDEAANGENDAVTERIRTFAGNVTDTRNRNYVTLAEGYPEIYDDAVAFNRLLNTEYTSWAAALDLT